MENFKKKAIELLMGLAVNEKKNPAVVPYIPAKLSSSANEKKSLQRRLGGPKRKYSRTLTMLLRELEYERRANIHNIMIIKNGEVICEASHPGYDTNVYHLAHSMSKTVTALAIGFLADEGKLDINQRVADIFPEISYKDHRFSSITVEHLLTMRSGVSFAELGSVTETRWTDAFFSSELSFAPGESFAYNSMNSYILGKIVTRITKRRLSDFLREKLFEPLDIDNYLWEIGPEGTEKGGFGLYLSCESFAKIGLMLLGCGSYNGRRIISQDFVSLMTRTHSYAPLEKGGFNYGYHIWTSRDSSDFLLNGMLGQNVLVSPENNVVVSINAGNNELFQDSPALEIIKKYISSLSEDSYATRAEFYSLKNRIKTFFVRRHWVRPKQKIRSVSTLLRLRDSKPFDECWNPVLGSYAFPENNSGILPLFISVMQNNYIGGIEKISLQRRKNTLLFTSVEGGIAYEIPVGLYGFEESIINFKGEKYIVRAIGEAMEDEDRNPVYKIELIFPELPNTRMIKITHAPEGIRVRLSESPNQRVADRFISSFTEGGKLGFAMGLIEKKIGEDFISKRLTSLFNPDLSGIDTRISGWESIIEAVNREICEKRESDNKFVKSFIGKFIGDEKEEKPKEEKPKSGGFLAKAISALFSKVKPAGEKESEGAQIFDFPQVEIVVPNEDSEKNIAYDSSCDENEQKP